MADGAKGVTTVKKRNMIIVALLIIVLIVASFFLGSYSAEQKAGDARLERCKTFIKFAIDKAENGDLTDEGTMRGLVSNIYAAYQFCGDNKSANQLHDLWNYLIFESNSNTDRAKEIALRELNTILYSIKVSD